jgi:hypothetical protein
MRKFLLNKKSLKQIAVLGCGLLAHVSVLAQYYDDPALGGKPVAQHPQDYKPLGFRAGSFMLHPGVQLVAEYNDNVFYAEDDTDSDLVLHVRPYITSQSTWSRHSFNITAAADIARFNDFSERDYEDYFLGISGRVDVVNRSYFSYSADYMNLHEDLNNRSSEQGIEPTRYDMTGASVGYDHTFNRLSVGATYSYSAFDYDDVLRSNGSVIENDDRDRSSDMLEFRAGYQFKTDMQAIVSYTGYGVDYDKRLDRNGYERSGDGYTATGGLNFTITNKLNGDISASYLSRSYDDPRLDKTDGWGLGAGLTWVPTDLTSVYARMDTSIQETTDYNNSGFLQRAYSIRVDHELLRYLQLNAFLGYRTYDYQNIEGTPGIARDQDDVWRAGLGANWFINRHAYLNASYSWEQLSSSLPNDDYDVNKIWLVLGLEY